MIQIPFVRFLLVGAFNTLLTFAIYEALLPFFTYGVAFTFSFIAGLVFTSLLNIRIVFSTQLTATTIIGFSAYYCFYYFLNLAALWLVIETAGVPGALAPLVTIPLLTPVNYLSSKYVIAQGDLWRSKKSHRDEGVRMSYAYDDRFLGYAANTSAASARKVIAILRDVRPISSVLDIGCARGTWLKEWQKKGVTDIHGVDGDYVDPSSLLIDSDNFTAVNLTEGFDLERKFDLVQSLEVAEHLPNSESSRFVELLVKHSHGLVLFSAAPPGQGGEHHINEQPYNFWRDQFRRLGYHPIDIVRPKCAKDSNVSYWYRYNIMLYASEAVTETLSDAVRSYAVPDDVVIADVSPPLFRLRKRIIRILPQPVVAALSRIMARLNS